MPIRKTDLLLAATLTVWVIGAVAIAAAVVALLVGSGYTTGGLFLCLILFPLALSVWSGLVIKLYEYLDQETP